MKGRELKDLKQRDKNLLIGAGIFAGLMVAAYAIYQYRRNRYPQLQVVSSVDLEKYAGEWFEIAKLPNKFEKNCHKSKANYSVNDDGSLKITNSCHEVEGSSDILKKVVSKGTVVDPQSNAKLKIHYKWPHIKGDYQIIALGSDYEYAMVGSQDRKYLWLLSRTPQLDLGIVKELMDIGNREGFDMSKLEFTHQ